MNHLDDKIKLAYEFFNDGWSLSVAMSKAGFPANWHLIKEIRNNDHIVQLKRLYMDRLDNNKRLTQDVV